MRDNTKTHNTLLHLPFDQHYNQINHQAHHATHKRSIDADELQVASDVEFYAVRHCVRVPFFDGIADDGGDFAFAVDDDTEQDLLQPSIDAMPDGFIVQKSI